MRSGVFPAGIRSGGTWSLHALRIATAGVGAACLLLAAPACSRAVSNSTMPWSPPFVGSNPSTALAVEGASRLHAARWQLSVSSGQGGTYRIHVADADGTERQVIDGPEAEPPYKASNLVALEDFSGDGRPDILARGLTVGTSALVSEHVYVYDYGSARFLDAEPFENEGEVTKSGRGCIAVEHRNPDNMTYSRDRYCWQGAWILRTGED